MKPSEQLVSEHEAILVMLEVLERMCRKIEQGVKVPDAHLRSIIDFFKVFADTCHHAKEEEFLFPAYQAAGIPCEGGPIGCMLAEHDEGRRAVAGMRSALDARDPDASSRFIAFARQYIGLLTAHIRKENEILFPMGDRVLSEERQQEILGQFEGLEEHRIGAGKHEEYHRMIESFETAYLSETHGATSCGTDACPSDCSSCCG